MKHFLDPTAEPVQSPPAGKVLYVIDDGIIFVAIDNAHDIADVLNQPSMLGYRIDQCGQGMVYPASLCLTAAIAPALLDRFHPHQVKSLLLITQGRDVNATLAVLRAQIARLTDITEWEEVQA